MPAFRERPVVNLHAKICQAVVLPWVCVLTIHTEYKIILVRNNDTDKLEVALNEEFDIVNLIVTRASSDICVKN